MTALYLSDAGFAVLEAANAQEALQLVGFEGPVDLLFCDINTPGDMDGEALVDWGRHITPDYRTSSPPGR